MAQADLRVRAASWNTPGEHIQDVVDCDRGHARTGGDAGATYVRCNHDVIEPKQWISSAIGSGSVTSRPAPANRPDFSAVTIAA